jgi:23S rRNA pseudouridine1911/1915/1917 synthase
MGMNRGWIYRDRISPTAAGQTVLDYYCQRYPHSSRQQWHDRLQAGQIWLGDRIAAPETVIEVGQILSYHRPPWQEPDVPIDFEILYDDANLLAVNKPSGLPVLPGGNFLDHTLLHQLRLRYPDLTPCPLHRLGRGTSGLLLRARTKEARSHLSRQLRERTLQKIYRARIGVCDLPPYFSIRRAIGKRPHPIMGYIYGVTAQGKPAVSEVRVLRRESDSTLIEIKIATGRPHQIRIHLAAIGYPLLGDPLYLAGGEINYDRHPESQEIPVPSDLGYALHSYSLSFIHPRDRQAMTLICPPPDALR